MAQVVLLLARAVDSLACEGVRQQTHLAQSERPLKVRARVEDGWLLVEG